MSNRTFLVTGGAGFIGSAFVAAAIADGIDVVNLDLLTYAGDLSNLEGLKGPGRHLFVKGDIGDQALVDRLLAEHCPDALINFAAESHVDRSIDGPAPFITTNIVGTFALLECSRRHLAQGAKDGFRFLHVSTDEVYGSSHGEAFTEHSPYAPNSPYAASKAGGDHLVRAYHRTYGLPGLITHCSNNYGPRQFPEKLIPVVVLNALAGKALPIYGDGRQIRDWIHVVDHCAGLRAVLDHGRLGEVYHLGAGRPVENIELVRTLCACLDQLRPATKPYAQLITHVTDRPGHDVCYKVDPSKALAELGWRAETSLEDGLMSTVRWYLDNEAWWQAIRTARYDGGRLGLKG